MGVEIERKFLTKGRPWNSEKGKLLRQGYLTQGTGKSIRIRISESGSFITIKGKRIRATRTEFEYEIPTCDAETLLQECTGTVISKYRHVVIYEGNPWVIDEFLGTNKGLIIAEIELNHENQLFKKPPWATQEVTDDARYYNSFLSQNPYQTW